MRPKHGVEPNAKKSREGTLPSELRELEKLIDAFADEFSFARNEVERLKKNAARVINAWRSAEAHHRQEHHQTRARLNTLFNGRIERWIYASDDEEMKNFFRRVWRDAPANGRVKRSPNSDHVSGGAVKPSAQSPSAKEML
jgi:hypothetical protein